MIESKKLKSLVLLAAYNGSPWIEEQIDSIINQQNIDVDIVISLDKSSDDTLSKILIMRERHSNIHLLNSDLSFGGAAKNFFHLIKSVDFENYDFVCLSDQDDIWLKDKVFRAAQVLMSNNADAYSSDVFAFWDDGSQIYVKKSYPQKEYDYIFEAAGPGCTYIFKSDKLLIFKSFLKNCHNSIESVELHDWFLYAFYRSRNFKWIIDSCPTMLYRQHRSNQIGVNFGLSAIVKRINLIRRGWYRNQINITSNILNFKIPSKLFISLNFLKFRRNPSDAFILLILNLLFLV